MKRLAAFLRRKKHERCFRNWRPSDPGCFVLHFKAAVPWYLAGDRGLVYGPSKEIGLGCVPILRLTKERTDGKAFHKRMKPVLNMRCPVENGRRLVDGEGVLLAVTLDGNLAT